MRYLKKGDKEREGTVSVFYVKADGSWAEDVQPGNQKSPYDKQIAEWTRKQRLKLQAKLAKTPRRKRAA